MPKVENGRLTPEQYRMLVQAVAEQVWKRMRHELRTDNERRAKRGRSAR